MVGADTAGSAAEIARANDPTRAAIASSLAGEIYGLKSLKKDLEEAKAAGVRGTPSMYINGRQHQGPMSPDKMGELVQKLLDGKL